MNGVNKMVFKIAFKLTVFYIFSPYFSSSHGCGNITTCRGYFGMNPSRMSDFDFFHSNCMCDEDCPIYGDCCQDAPVNFFPHSSGKEFTCVEMMKGYQQYSFYLKSQCHYLWKRKNIQKLCETGSEEALYDLYVTNMKLNITYRNIFCAACNWNPVNDLLPWEFQLQFGFKFNNFRIVYAEKVFPFIYQQILDESSDLDTLFRRVKKSVKVLNFPNPFIFSRLRRCKPNINECSENWKDEDIKLACYGHTHYYFSSKSQNLYKNTFCAHCNSEVINCLNQELMNNENSNYIPDSATSLLKQNGYVKNNNAFMNQRIYTFESHEDDHSKVILYHNNDKQIDDTNKIIVKNNFNDLNPIIKSIIKPNLYSGSYNIDDYFINRNKFHSNNIINNIPENTNKRISTNANKTEYNRDNSIINNFTIEEKPIKMNESAIYNVELNNNKNKNKELIKTDTNNLETIINLNQNNVKTNDIETTTVGEAISQPNKKEKISEAGKTDDKETNKKSDKQEMVKVEQNDENEDIQEDAESDSRDKKENETGDGEISESEENDEENNEEESKITDKDENENEIIEKNGNEKTENKEVIGKSESNENEKKLETNKTEENESIIEKNQNKNKDFINIGNDNFKESPESIKKKDQYIKESEKSNSSTIELGKRTQSKDKNYNETKKNSEIGEINDKQNKERMPRIIENTFNKNSSNSKHHLNKKKNIIKKNNNVSSYNNTDTDNITKKDKYNIKKTNKSKIEQLQEEINNVSKHHEQERIIESSDSRGKNALLQTTSNINISPNEDKFLYEMNKTETLFDNMNNANKTGGIINSIISNWSNVSNHNEDNIKNKNNKIASSINTYEFEETSSLSNNNQIQDNVQSFTNNNGILFDTNLNFDSTTIITDSLTNSDSASISSVTVSSISLTNAPINTKVDIDIEKKNENKQIVLQNGNVDRKNVLENRNTNNKNIQNNKNITANNNVSSTTVLFML